MPKISLIYLFGVVAFGQSQIMMSGTASLKSGVWVRYKSVLSRTAGPPVDLYHGLRGGGVVVGADTIHRLMADGLRGTYFGYDLVIRPAGGENKYMATFQPPSNVSEILKHMNGDALTLMPPPKYPGPQIVHDGDIIEFDLMTSPDGKQRLTDYIEIFSHAPEPPAAKTTAEPRDFTVDDGSVAFDGSRITVWKQGKQLPSNGFTGRPGATFWIAVPDQGRYILSLTPHEGFAKAGAIRDNVISFEDAGQEYEVRFMSPIAGAGKAWNLYLMQDLAYVPDPSLRNQVSMGTDRLEHLLPNRSAARD